jgi:hypothetical protein
MAFTNLECSQFFEVWTLNASHSGGNDRFCARLKRTFRPLTPASEVVRGRALHFWKEVAETNLKW